MRVSFQIRVQHRLLTAMLSLTAFMFAIAVTYGLPDDITEELARMSREIASRHFLKSTCVALVTDNNNDIVDYIHPLDIPVLHVHLPLAVMKDSKVQPSGL
jgi:hypothetical protein